MLVNTGQLSGMVIRATDGDIGSVDQVYFDDETWAVRYLKVETDGWLSGRQVLISPYSVLHLDWQAKRVDVALTKEQLEKSPSIDTHKPVSRQHEAAYLGYYGYPSYWDGPYLWGPGLYPMGQPASPMFSVETTAKNIGKQSLDSHLRSSESVGHYSVEATDGDIGRVAGFLIDDESWAIRYIEVSTRNWWPGKKVLVSPAWIERISWQDSKVFANLSRETIKNAPEYHEDMPVDRDYEDRLHAHYGRPAYWSMHAGEQTAASLGA